MSETFRPSRFRKRPLLVASLGIAVLSVAAAGGFACGNLVAPTCPDGGTRCFDPVDAGTKADAGTDGGVGGDN